MKIFPYTLIRLAGDDFGKLERLKFGCKIVDLVEQTIAIRLQLQQLRLQLCDQLYLLIKHSENKKQQIALLNLKRAVFNNRDLDALSEQAVLYLDGAARNALVALSQLQQSEHAILAEGERAFAMETISLRIQLYRLALSENLQQGLLLSSQFLLERLKPYISNSNKKNNSLKKN